MNRADDARFTWVLLTGEYPPQQGGVADYTFSLAAALAASGDDVRVFAPPCPDRPVEADGVSVHRLPDAYGPRARAMLWKALAAIPEPRAVVVQYVAQSFGLRGCNIFFAAWLRKLKSYPLFIMFHEVSVTVGPATPFKYRLQALATRTMARSAIGAADAIFTSTPSWAPLIDALRSPHAAIDWMAVPSNIPFENDRAATSALRTRLLPGERRFLLGHFGTYREKYTRESLTTLVPLLIGEGRSMLFLGRGSEEFVRVLRASYPEHTERLHATGDLSPVALADHLAACDLLIQPFEEGVTARRSSVAASLALGVPLVTTIGVLTEPFWIDGAAVRVAPAGDIGQFVAIVDRLASEPETRAKIAVAERALYAQRFAIGHTTATLRRRTGRR